MKVILGLITLLFVLSTMIVSLNAQEKEEGQQSDREWQFGVFVDSAYLLNFNHPENSGVVGLTPRQNLLTFGTILTFDSPAPR